MTRVKWVLAIAVVVPLVGWWLTFGTLSPCDSMKGELRRAARNQGGILGQVLVDRVADVATASYTPAQCIGRAVSLKLNPESTLKEMAADALPPQLRM